ncbi:hypothetical protein [Mycobacterium sp. NPDC050853]|uniref:hypothetical protein n=1 Tax=Mycobacterium sp. NPDC050853 TaxID=3155160 RepID=UPI0033D88185
MPEKASRLWAYLIVTAIAFTALGIGVGVYSSSTRTDVKVDSSGKAVQALTDALGARDDGDEKLVRTKLCGKALESFDSGTGDTKVLDIAPGRGRQVFTDPEVVASEDKAAVLADISRDVESKGVVMPMLFRMSKIDGSWRVCSYMNVFQ